MQNHVVNPNAYVMDETFFNKFGVFFFCCEPLLLLLLRLCDFEMGIGRNVLFAFGEEK